MYSIPKTLLIAFLPLFLGGGFFSSVSAQEDNDNGTSGLASQIQDLHRLDTLLENLPFVVVKNASILTKNDGNQAILTGDIYQIRASQIRKILSKSRSFDELYQKIRIDVIKFLMQQGYMNFNNQPYKEGNLAIFAHSGDFKVLKSITGDDALDVLLAESLTGLKSDFTALKKYRSYLKFKSMEITPKQYSQLGTLFMFKNEQDLRDLGYELISWKTRVNSDPDYRRHNIKTAFSNIGYVRLILPKEIFSVARELHYNPNLQDGGQPFVDGYATFGNGARMVYGGGICGVATAFYQGTLTNLGFSLIEYRAHSIYYRNLYEAEVNGEYIRDPGLDATIYAPLFDLKVKNIRPYPIVVVFNFDELSGSQEQVFTLSKPQDRGSFKYIGTYKKPGFYCFTRKINGKNRTNCYTHIRNF